MSCGDCKHMVERRRFANMTLGTCYQHWMRVTTSHDADECKKFEKR
jgi:hypothetical protein